MNIQSKLHDLFTTAMTSAGADMGADPVIKPSSKKEFGDYQANGMMGVAKKLGKNPRELAQSVLDNLPANELIAKTEIADPGFVNIFLANDFLEKSAQVALNSPTLGIDTTGGKKIVVDYSAPNVAKEMHVGHLRSTIIGDSMVRTLEFLGNTVIRANHIGDWGTQFGMLIAYLELVQTGDTDEMALSDIEEFYRSAKAKFDSDEDFATTARQNVVKLQSGDENSLKLWQQLVDVTMNQCQATYDRLNVTLTKKDIMGESLYNPILQGVVDSLIEKGIATKDDGATVVYMDEYKNKEGNPLGVIVQKNDGGFLYTTTDIAAAHYRYKTLGADEVIIFTDARQAQHMKQAWAIARLGGFVPDDFKMNHFTFGMMLGKDGKPFKTRTGGTVKLADLLDEAIERATTLMSERQTKLSESEKQALIKAVAIGAVKYADLSKNRNTDYVFDWDNMLSFEGNTAPYMQYAYTRVRSIFSKAELNPDELTGDILVNDEHERTLTLKLLQFEDALRTLAKDGTPNVLALYLYELAGIFSSFYEHCPILSADEPIKTSRLLLAKLTADTLKLGLDLLGIKTVEKM
ncbi:arginine--tRNA ligase [Moraxella haemolytica]|uniref:arginine--tRNA ligase n=1 Tax=Moraxella haemolytica TaxID=2904119 RepID=UPI002543BEDC|nr:arginine--tRNA ligase [Moraxella sp. ZY171148]WII95815.1 arginine--tRNA ligase [Moraxella sp. ZY171148]